MVTTVPSECNGWSWRGQGNHGLPMPYLPMSYPPMPANAFHMWLLQICSYCLFSDVPKVEGLRTGPEGQAWSSLTASTLPGLDYATGMSDWGMLWPLSARILHCHDIEA